MESSTLKRTAPSRGVSAPEHTILWAGAPVLRAGSRAGYGGRIIAEVWEDGTVHSVADPAQIPSALTALSTVTPLREAPVALPATPITGPHHATYLGRVIV